METKEIEVAEFKNDLPIKVPQYLKEIADLTGKSKELVLADINDKDQLKVIKAMRIQLKNARVGVEKYMKNVRDGANAFSKSVILKEKEIVALIEPEETRLEAEEGKYEAEVQRLAEIARKAEEETFNRRVTSLTQLGFKLSPDGYSLQGCTVSITEARLMAEIDWINLFGGEVRKAAEKQAEIEKEEARIKEERKAEEARLREENERLKREESLRLEVQRQEQEKERERLELERAEQRKRQEAIEAKERELQEIENKRLAEIKEKAEAERKEKERQELVKQAEESARLKAIEEEKRKQEELAIKQKKEAEKAARQPDKKKLLVFIKSIREAIEKQPELKSEESKHVLSFNVNALTGLLDDFVEQSEKL